MSDVIPSIVIRAPSSAGATEPQDSLPALVQWLSLLRRDGEAAAGGGLGALLHGLVLEGRAFARTSSGARWRSILAPSGVAANGWLIWNSLDLDRLVQRTPPPAATPGERAEAMVRMIGGAPLEAVMRVLSEAALAEAAKVSDDE